MNNAIFAILLTVVSNLVCAQTTKSLELKPIYRQGSKYFYGDKKVRNGYALQVPLLALEDDEINQRFKNFTTIRKIGRYSYLVPLIYLITISSSNRQGQTQINRSKIDTWSAVFWGAVATNIGCNIVSNVQLGKGIDRYNTLIFKNNVGLQLNYTPETQMACFGFSYRF